MSTGEKFQRVVDIMARLRAPGGCPWDREQTFDSIKPYTLEETYEVFEAIERQNWKELPGELGDLLLQVIFYAQMAAEQGLFNIDDVNQSLAAKLIGRHPHVFGDGDADVNITTSAEVLRNWEALKKAEKGTADDSGQSLLANVSQAMPALLEATKLSKRAATVGFDWPNLAGIFAKLDEEANELKHHIHTSSFSSDNKDNTQNNNTHRELEGEVGDLLFVVVNLARRLRIDPEAALRSTNRKFRRRFARMEAAALESGKKMEECPIEELEGWWQQAKLAETEGHS